MPIDIINGLVYYHISTLKILKIIIKRRDLNGYMVSFV